MATISKLPSGHWRVQIRIQGHAPATKTFRTKAQAQRWAIQTEDQIRHGIYQDGKAAESRTLRDHLDWYLEQITPRKSPGSLRQERNRIRRLQEHPIFTHCTLANLSPETVLKYVDARKADGVIGSTITRELALLGHALNAGSGLLRITLPHGNPVEQARNSLRFTKTLVVRDARDRRLLPGEEEKLLAELGPIMRAAVIILLETGMRREELCNARREHIRGNTLHIPQAKTGSRTIPLSPRALAAIAELSARDGLLLGMRPDSVTQAFGRACKRAGIEGLRVHDCRHECASRLAEWGWTIPEIAAVIAPGPWNRK